MNTGEELHDTLDVYKLFHVVKVNFFKLFVWMLAGGVIAYIATVLFITPKYNSSIDLLVNQKESNSQAQYTAQQADLQAINTYKDVLKKQVILDEVLTTIKKRDNYQGSLEKLQNSIAINNATDSQVITVSVTDTNPYVASDIANSVGKVFDKKIKKMMKVNNVTIVSKATPKLKPISPNRGRNTIIGLVLGFVFGFILYLFMFLKDTTVKSTDFLVDELGLTLLGNIYHIPSKDQKKFVVSINTHRQVIGTRQNAERSRRV